MSNTNTRNGTAFENDVLNYVNNFIEKESAVPTTKWQQYISELFHDSRVSACKKTNASIGKEGNTEDIVVTIQKGTLVKLSCKKNNLMLSHPRVKSFMDDTYHERYATIKSQFDADTSRKTHMYMYYELLAQLTKTYIENNPAKVFAYLYPSDIHLIHDSKDCYYIPILLNTAGESAVSSVIVKIEPGKGNKQGKSCNLILKFDNNICFKMRIHNCEGNKAIHSSNPFKWEVTLQAQA